VGKKRRNPDWAEAKRRCGLSDDDIRMAKELGMSPHSLTKNIPSRNQLWKAPVPEWVRGLYQKKFGAKEPLAFPSPIKQSDDATGYDYFEREFDGSGESGDPDFLTEELEAPTSREIEDQNAIMLRGQRNLRAAAEYVSKELAFLPEVVRVALFGSVAGPLRKEIPRFPKFRSRHIAVWHECNDVDLAVWVTDLSRLKHLQKARGRALNQLLAERDIGVPHFEVDLYILEPGTDRYRGRLCDYGECPKPRKDDCLVDGCGVQPFLRQFRDYTFDRFEFWESPKEILFERDPSAVYPARGWPDDPAPDSAIGYGGITDDDVPF